MSKKFFVLLQSLLVLGSVGQAFANNMTLDVYERGQYKGTMNIPSSQYHNVANRMRGTGVTVRPQARPDAEARRRAAEQRMDEWRRQDEQRRRAAQRQQEQWNRDFERRRIAAQQRMNQWNMQAEQRRVAAHRYQEQWRQEMNRRQVAAQREFRAWQAGY